MQHSTAQQFDDARSRELEVLLRAVLYHSSQAILIVDDDRNCLDASFGACRLAGLARQDLIVRKLDALVAPSFASELASRWTTFLAEGIQDGVFPLVVPARADQEVRYIVRGSVLPKCHLVVLFPDERRVAAAEEEAQRTGVPSPETVRDFALFLLDPEGRVAAWYAGAERIYGYSSQEVVGQSLSFFDPPGSPPGDGLHEELVRTAALGRYGAQGWRVGKGGSRFWANALTSVVETDDGRLLGFARVVRDFTDFHEAELHASAGGEGGRAPLATEAAIGIVTGEFDRVTDASDAFLAMVGYDLDDLTAGRTYWPDLTPAEFSDVEERAHEEALIHGACAPFEKEYIRKDGERVRVLVTGAVIGLSPFRWITLVQDLMPHGPEESDAENVSKQGFAEIVGQSHVIRRVLGQVEMVAPTEATVLILGETGTGKELVARAVHRLSLRSGPFVTLNCAAIPTGLLESELFGYEKGAFTGALNRKIGRFEVANQGTLFLDEVGDIPLELQPKLLRALQEKEFERLGGTRTIPIDVRLVAATNRDLTQMMVDKLFRSDLYYRLKVFPIKVPPLRDHRDDIPELTQYFVNKYARQIKRDIPMIPPATMRALCDWSWPGNVRELENFIERSVILSQGGVLRAPLAEIQKDAVQPVTSSTMSHMEREHIIRVLKETGGVVSRAAAKLGMPRTTLNAMMRKLEISRSDF